MRRRPHLESSLPSRRGLCEARAYRQALPDLSITTYQADFKSVLPTILKDLPADAFAFFLIDPKGWRIPLDALKPMLARPNSELIFNFMLDFINHAASIKDPVIAAGLDELIPLGGFRAKLQEAEKAHPDGLSAEERKLILVDAFNVSPNSATTLMSPRRRSFAPCADRHEADCIVAETNFGGSLVEAVVKAAASDAKLRINFKAVKATRDKVVRAEPVAAFYEQGKVHHVGAFPELEDQLAAFSTHGYLGDGSPDRADALIWGVTEIFPRVVSRGDSDWKTTRAAP